MRGSIPLSSAKKDLHEVDLITIKYSKMYKLIKELQNLYSWNQFYQERKMKPEMKKCQAQIKAKKQEVNEFKMAKKKKGGKI